MAADAEYEGPGAVRLTKAGKYPLPPPPPVKMGLALCLPLEVGASELGLGDGQSSDFPHVMRKAPTALRSHDAAIYTMDLP
jgi:hypothetical protein